MKATHDRVVFGMCEELAPHLAEEIDFADVDKSGGIFQQRCHAL